MEQKRKFDRRNKGGRPKKGAADKLKYRLTVKMATSDYYGLCPPALRNGEQPEPACAQGERRRLRHGEDGMPCTRGTYRGTAEFNPLMTVGYDS